MFCPKCGSKVPNNKEKCDKCGALIEDEEIEILSEEKTIKMEPIQIEELDFDDEDEELEEQQMTEPEQLDVIDEPQIIENEPISDKETNEKTKEYQLDEPQLEKNIFGEYHEENDTPVIIESHTFIDDDSLKNQIEEKITEEDLINHQQRKDKIRKYSIIGALTIVLITLGVFVPKITTMNKSTVNMRKVLDTAIVINGEKYNIYDTYNKFKANGWTSEEEEEVVAEKAKTSIIEINHEKYKGNEILISMINQDNKEKDISECGVWSIKIDNYKKDYPIEFILPGNIKNGSTIDEIIKAYGKLDEDNIYRSEQSGYTKYHYKDETNSYLDLVVYDDLGLRTFTYMRY